MQIRSLSRETRISTICTLGSVSSLKTLECERKRVKERKRRLVKESCQFSVVRRTKSVQQQISKFLNILHRSQPNTNLYADSPKIRRLFQKHSAKSVHYAPESLYSATEPYLELIRMKFWWMVDFWAYHLAILISTQKYLVKLLNIKKLVKVRWRER